MQCEEIEIPLNDGVKRIFLNTKGKNEEEVPELLIDFLGYLNDSTDAYVENYSNEKVKEIHERDKTMKKNRFVEGRYMHYLYVDKLLEEQEKVLKEREHMIKEREHTIKEQEHTLKEAENIIKEMILEAVGRFGGISELVRERIEKEKDIQVLKSMYKATNANSKEQFESQIASL